MKTIAATKLAVVTLVTSVIALLSSCRNDFDFDYAHGNATKDDIAYNDRFNELIGDIDPNHTWSTATSTQVYYDLDKTFDGFANIYSVSEKSSLRYFLGQIPVENGIITGKFDRPSTTSTIYFEAVDKDGYINKTGYVALDDLYQDATRSADFGMYAGNYGVTRAITLNPSGISVKSNYTGTKSREVTKVYTWQDAIDAGDEKAVKRASALQAEVSTYITVYVWEDVYGNEISEFTRNDYTAPSGYSICYDNNYWTNTLTQNPDQYASQKQCHKKRQIDNYEIKEIITGYGFINIHNQVIGTVDRNNQNQDVPSGYYEIPEAGLEKKITEKTSATFVHLNGIQTEAGDPITIGQLESIIVGKDGDGKGKFYEGQPNKILYEDFFKPDVKLTTSGGPLSVTFQFGATQYKDKFAYYFWKDGDDPYNAKRYILMEDARPNYNVFIESWENCEYDSNGNRGVAKGLNGSGNIGDMDWANFAGVYGSPAPEDKLVYGTKYHIPYTADGVSFTYEWPANYHVAFVMLSRGSAGDFLSENEYMTWAMNSVRSHNADYWMWEYNTSWQENVGTPAYNAITCKMGNKIVCGFEDNPRGTGDMDMNDILFFLEGFEDNPDIPVAIEPASLTIKYLDIDTNEPVAPQVTKTDYKRGDIISETALTGIANYDFNSSTVNGSNSTGDQTRTITLATGADNEIIFYYKRNSDEPTPPVTPTPTTGNYVVHHYIKGTETKLFEDESGSGNVGSNVDVRAKSKDGYTFDTSKVGDHGELHNAVETITIIDGTIVVIFYYTPITYQSYIIACEDLGNSATSDFDYNDIVFEIVPMRDQKKVLVRPLAEGGTMEAYILFDPSGLGNFSKVKEIGPSGKEEVHKWLTGNASQSYKEMLNTGKSAVHNNAEAYEIVDESGNISMASNWDKYFCVLVNKDGSELTGTEVSYDSKSVVFSKNSASAAPRLLCISDNNWLWMQERVKIDEAYPNFCEWAANASSSAEWYKEPITSQDLHNFVTRRTVVEQVEETVEEIETPNAANTVLTITSGSTQTAITDPTEPTTVAVGEYPLSVESVSTNSRAMAPEWSFYVRESSDLANVKNGNILHIGKNEGSTQIFTLVAKYGDKDITSCKIRVAGEDGSALWAGEISPNGGWPGTKIDLNTTVLAHAMPSSEIWIYYKNGTDGNYLNIQYGTNPEYNQYGSFNWKKDAKNSVLKVNLNNNIITYLKSHPYIYFQGEQNKYIITKVELK